MANDNYALITRTFARTIWQKFIKAMEEYKLIEDGDVIWVPEDKSDTGTLAGFLAEMVGAFGMRRITVVHGGAPAEYNKIVAPECFHDILYNNLWEMLYNGRIHSLLPKQNKDGATVIRPLYFVRRENIEEWKTCSGLDFEPGIMDANKAEQITLIKELVDRMAATNDSVENNVFGSVFNVDADMMVGYELGDVHHEFLEKY